MKRKIQRKELKGRFGYTKVPALLLAGLWFQEAGFKIGQEVTVTVVAGQVIISS